MELEENSYDILRAFEKPRARSHGVDLHHNREAMKEHNSKLDADKEVSRIIEAVDSDSSGSSSSSDSSESRKN